MEKLIKVLKSSPINEYKINIIETTGNELFYIIDKLETSRAVNLKEVEVTIYIDRDDKRGCSSFMYYDYMNEEEIQAEIDKTIYAASFALNPFYEIPGKSNEELLKIHSNFADRPLKQIAQDIARAIFRCEKVTDGFLSATEIFVSKKNIRIINSKGVDVSETRYEGYVEVIPSWGNKENEVETYNAFTFSNFDADWITAKINELIHLTEARFYAKKLEVKDTIKVIIEDEGVPSVFNYFSRDLSYANKVRGTGRDDIGAKVQGDNVEGTLLNIDMVPFDEESAIGAGFDNDGVILRPVNLIKDGRPDAQDRPAVVPHGARHPGGVADRAVLQEAAPVDRPRDEVHDVRNRDLQVPRPAHVHVARPPRDEEREGEQGQQGKARTLQLLHDVHDLLQHPGRLPRLERRAAAVLPRALRRGEGHRIRDIQPERRRPRWRNRERSQGHLRRHEVLGRPEDHGCADRRQADDRASPGPSRPLQDHMGAREPQRLRNHPPVMK